MKRIKIYFKASDAATYTKYESEQTTLLMNTHIDTIFKRILVSCKTPSSSSFMLLASFSTEVFAKLMESMIQYFPHTPSWISHPNSGFLPMETCIGGPIFIHSPTKQYHPEIYSSACMWLEGKYVDCQRLLKFSTKSSTNFHRYD